jgi:VanZ family protein
MTKCKGQPSVFWRVILTALLVGLLGFIFSNSLQTGEQSSAQSGGVTALVQEIAKKIAPNSKIATATGEAYDTLHAFVRLTAHFLEFCALGAVMVWCFYSYTLQKRHAPIAWICTCLTACLDELLQTLTAGRGAEIKDILVDCLGGAFGAVFAVLVIVIILSQSRPN